MNLIDAVVKEVLDYTVKKSSEMWELDENEIDMEHHIYTVKYVDDGGPSEKELWFRAKNDDIKEGYRFTH